MKRIALFVFVLLSLLEVGGEVFGWQQVHVAVKPLLMPALLAWYWLVAGAGQRSVWVLAALIFSCAGDTLLMFQGEGSFFIFGLGAFLTAHIFYVFAYRQHQHEDPQQKINNIQKLRMAFPVVLAGTGLLIVLFPVLGALQVPVVVYATVIVVMVCTAIFRLGRTTASSFAWVLFGAVLFMISDATLAVNKFYAPFGHAGVWIMFAYLAGQWAIVYGLTRHHPEPITRDR